MTEYNIMNRAGPGPAIMHLVGEVDMAAQRRVLADLGQLRGRRIELHINSGGGEYHAGLAVYHALRAHSPGVTVVVDGAAGSMASVIAMAGRPIRMHRGSSMHIHDVGMADAEGYLAANRVAAIAVQLTAWSNDMAEIYARRAGGTAEQWRQRMIAETFFTASQAVELGLADEIVSDRELVPAARTGGPRVIMFTPHNRRTEGPGWPSLFDPALHRRGTPLWALLSAPGPRSQRTRPQEYENLLRRWGLRSALRSPLGQQIRFLPFQDQIRVLAACITTAMLAEIRG